MPWIDWASLILQNLALRFFSCKFVDFREKSLIKPLQKEEKSHILEPLRWWNPSKRFLLAFLLKSGMMKFCYDSSTYNYWVRGMLKFCYVLASELLWGKICCLFRCMEEEGGWIRMLLKVKIIGHNACFKYYSFPKTNSAHEK